MNIWLARSLRLLLLSWGGAILLTCPEWAGLLDFSGRAIASTRPLPGGTEINGYAQYWLSQSPEQRLRQAQRTARPDPATPAGAPDPLSADPLRADPLSALNGEVPADPVATTPTAQGEVLAGLTNLPPEPALASEKAEDLAGNPRPWIHSENLLDILAPTLIEQQQRSHPASEDVATQDFATQDFATQDFASEDLVGDLSAPESISPGSASPVSVSLGALTPPEAPVAAAPLGRQPLTDITQLRSQVEAARAETGTPTLDAWSSPPAPVEPDLIAQASSAAAAEATPSPADPLPTSPLPDLTDLLPHRSPPLLSQESLSQESLSQEPPARSMFAETAEFWAAYGGWSGGAEPEAEPAAARNSAVRNSTPSLLGQASPVDEISEQDPDRPNLLDRETTEIEFVSPGASASERASETEGTEASDSISGSVTSTTPIAPELLDRFPVFPAPDSNQVAAPNAESLANNGDATTLNGPTPPSSARQQLEATVESSLPLDPSQLNITADDLSFDPQEEVGIASGNARIQLSDGTTITGDRLLFYRQEGRLVSEGPFRLVQPANRQQQRRDQREISGRNLDYHIPSRSAEFENSLTILPGEEPGTYVYVRSETTTALLGDEIFFDRATVTTSPEAPITHYVQGDRVEVFPDDQLIVRSARVFVGGEQVEDGTLRGGTQVAFLPLFIYSLRAHQWILPGQSAEEGFFVKTSWAYRFNEYNFGGLRIDALQRKGIGLGFVHDYILPIDNSVNYGRAQFYVVTEADQGRSSNRLRLDHFFDFYDARIFGQEGTLTGQLNANFDNVYRPGGGRNDNADVRLNASFRTSLSTTTLNVNRTGSLARGTYSLPITVNHNQRFGGVNWLTSDIRFNYNRRVLESGGDPLASSRLELTARARPPGWGGNYTATYRGFSSSEGDFEARRNLQLDYTANNIRLGRNITWANSLSASRNQILDPESRQDPNLDRFLQFYGRYDLRSSLRFSPIEMGDRVTFFPGSLDYQQTLYSTDNQESIVTLNPRLIARPTETSQFELRYNRTIVGDNSAPFQAARSSVPRDRLTASFNIRNDLGGPVDAPPGFLAFEDDLPGEAPIAIIFEDDTPEELEALASQEQEALQQEVRNALRFDSTAGYDFVTQRWDLLTANFTWNTIPNLFDLRVQTSYDLNEGELRPITLQYSRRSSTTFDRNLRAGLDIYEPGLTYGLRAVYDPRSGEFSSYSLDLDATIGTRWQNHWRFRLGLDQRGVNRVEVRRDLRDFELRLAYDPQSEIFRFESILVAFPSRPVGLTQQRGDFLLNAPGTTLNFSELLP